jgi:putative oxygen-independent coproporphyrinogen III oxidase
VSAKAQENAGTRRPFGIYVHWPFCVSKCPYCDFNSHVRESVDHQAWARALTAEIRHYAAMTPGRTVDSVFFGGGTPSLMQPETVAAVLDQIGQSWTRTNDLEVTLEANPTSVETEKFRAFKDAGVNRVSVGIQSLHDDQLKFLGRAHDAAQGRAAIAMAASLFDRYSFDLIYARPEQGLQAWAEELKAALTMAGGHLSLYQLTIEQGTAFHTQHARGDFEIPESDLGADFYELTQDLLGAAGLPAYEISNHARPGQESRHNLIYWRYGDYVGVGPGAHGRLTLDDGCKIGTRAHSAPEIWLERVRANGHGAHDYEHLSREQRFTESVMMGLRLREGVVLDRLSGEAGRPWQEMMDEKRVRVLADEGLLVLDAERLRPTLQGMQRLNGILGYLLA